MKARVGLCAWLLLLGGAVSPVFPRAEDPPGEWIDDPDAYAVYGTLLPSEWQKHARAKTLLFREETARDLPCEPAGKPLDTNWKPVLDNFRTVNAHVMKVRTGFPIGLPYEVVPEVEFKALFQGQGGIEAIDTGWTIFSERYPDSGDSLVVVSAVGFDREKRRALVYMAHYCGSLCGGGAHHFLEKVDGAWREVKVEGLKSCIWVS